MRIMPLPTRMLLVFIALFVGAAMASVLASTESEAAHGTGTTYDVGGIEVTTYYTPVESYYVRDCIKTIQVWPDFSTSGSKITAGPYPCSFVSHTKGEGSGKITSGVFAGSYLNWSYEGLGPNGDQQGFWIDTCPRDAYGGCLQAKVSAAVSENLAQNFGLRRGETFHLENCGTEAANTTACDYFKSGNWIVNDQFTTGIASDKQIDLYYGEQESGGFRDSAYWMSMYDATIRVNPPPDYEPPDTGITSGPSGTVNSTTASFAFSSNEAGSTFECSLDYADYAPCSSPKDYTGLTSGNHTFRVRATDAALNTDTTSASRTWRVDTIAPKGTIVINGGAASTASRTVKLALNATDPAPASGIASMRFRNSGTTTWSAWQTYATSRSWTLTSGTGTKTVYVQYRDKALNVSAAALDSIIYRP